jgi:hypothetical protein
MIWGAISLHGRSRLLRVVGTLNADRYQTGILETEAIPMYYDRPLQIFQQDNASCHSARSTIQFLEAHGVVVLQWPARSPDLSPIEHVWDVIGRRLQSEYEYPPSSLDQLYERLVVEWNNFPEETVVNLINSVSNRVAACIAARGGHTRY